MRYPKVMHNETIHKFVIPQIQQAGFDLHSEIELPVGIDRVYKLSGVIKLDRKVFPDILLFCKGFILAVIEVKPVGETEWCGFEQAFKYAKELGVRLAISTNGNKYIIFDMYKKRILYDGLDYFPFRDELIGMCPNYMREAPSLKPIDLLDVITQVKCGEKRLDEVINLFGFPMCGTMGVVQQLKKNEMQPSILNFRYEGLQHAIDYYGVYFKVIEDLIRCNLYHMALDTLDHDLYPDRDINYLKILRMVCWINSGELHNMAYYFRTWVESKLVFGELYNIIAEELIVGGYNELAYMYLEKGQLRNGEDSKTKELMAIIHYKWRDYENSVRILNEIIKQGRNFDRLCLLGKCLFSMGEIDSSIKIFVELLSLGYNASEMGKNIDIIKEVMMHYCPAL